MSLLDDVSIVVTPNGYKAGELYAVVPVPTYGAEEVTDGDFPTGTTAWSSGNGWSVSNNTLINDGSVTTAQALQNNIINGTVGTIYKLTFNVLSATDADLRFYSPNVGYISQTVNTGDIPTYLLQSSGAYEYLTARNYSGAEIILDNISVKEYTSADMDVTRETAATRVDENGLVNYAEVLGDSVLTGNNSNFDTGIGSWVGYNGGTLAHSTDKLQVTLTTGESGARINTNGLISGGQAGKTFKVRARVWQGTTTSTTLKIYIGGNQENINISSTPTYFEVELTPPNSGDLFIYKSGSVDTGTYFIDDVTVKEVTRDNVPRIDYTGGGCPHILAEPQRTNLIPYSSNFNQWTNSGVTLTPNYGVSVDGTNNATRFKISAGSRGVIYNSVAVTVGQSYTISFYVKSLNGIQKIRIGADGGCVNPQGAETFNVNTEWQRISTTITSNYNPWNYYIDNVESGILCTGTYLETDILIYGAQLEEGLYPTSLIPTNGEAGGVTRNQDIFTRDGIGSLINSTEGTFFIDVEFDTLSGLNMFLSVRPNSSNKIEIYRDGNLLYGEIASSTSFSFIKTGVTVGRYKIAFAYSSGSNAMYINGDLISSNSTSFAFTSTLNDLYVNSRGGTSFIEQAKYYNIQIYKTALTDVQLAALTS